MNHLRTLVAMQLRDKVDLSWIHKTSSAIRNILFSLSKLIIVTALVYIILYLCNYLGIFTFDESPLIVVLVLTVSLSLSLISCTFELMKNLYFSEDNRVLITLPVNTNKIFISKLIVYYIYELKKSLSFIIPITLGCLFLLVFNNLCSPVIFIWMWIPLMFIIALPVLLGALLSIPMMYIYRFLKRYSIAEIILFLVVLVLAIIGVVYLINLLPTEPGSINLINQWKDISRFINDFLKGVEKYCFLLDELLSIIIGEKQSNLMYSFELITFIKFGILVAITLVLYFGAYFISRPIFFGMMAKNFEINKKETNNGKNKRHNKYLTFVNKEFIINLRTLNISINYLMIYIIVPILIFFINRIFGAMQLSTFGQRMVYAINALLITLPMLASNSMVATYYSREGRAGYMKKTKPIYALYPLLTKLFFNVAFSIPTVFITSIIFGVLTNISFGQIILFGFAVLFLHVGHMIYSATLDIMNPQNEQYATTGITIDNPNENKSTILAFILAAAFALITYRLLYESSLGGSLTLGFTKLFGIGLIYAACTIYMFIKRIYAYYYEI